MNRDLAKEGRRTRIGFLRFLARYMDLFLAIGLPFAFLPVDSLDSFTSNPTRGMLLGLSMHAFTAVVEAASVSRFGTSPDKWLFGLQIKNLDGSNHSFGTIFERYFVVLSIGQAFMVPAINFFVGLYHLRRFTREEVTTWDTRYGTAITWQGLKWKRLG